jgi:Fe-S cluster assembly protein SufD
MKRQEPSLETRILESWRSMVERGLNGFFQEERAKAIARFEDAGFPPHGSEAWKYTPIGRMLGRLPELDLDPSASGASNLVGPEEAQSRGIPALEADQVVLVDGKFRKDLSSLGNLHPGLRVSDLREAIKDPSVCERLDSSGETARDAFADLNSAFMRDGVFVEVAERVSVERPLVILHLLSASAPSLVQPRILGVFGQGSQLRMIEICRTVGVSPTVSNSMVEFFTASNARVDHVRIIDEGEGSIHINNLRSYQEGDSRFATNVISLSKGAVRNQAYFLPNGENCETFLSGFYLGQGSAHIDNHTLVDHARPECFSDELFKGVLSGHSKGVFNGKVLVRQDAQKINAYQTSKSVILDDTAAMYAKPELEIYADDVKCSHGATTGELDSEAMFYLQSRGIRAEEAQLMLLEAFAGDVFDRIELEPVRAHVDSLFRDRLYAN